MICNKKLSTVNFSAMTNKTNKYLVIHYVASVSTAKNNADYFYSVNRGASCHYFVDGSSDIDQACYQVVSELNAAWHVGATTYKHADCRNTNSIGIEICCVKDSAGKVIMDTLAIERAIELAKSICEMWGITKDRVLRHYDVTGKNCPAEFVTDENRWNEFKNKVFNSDVSSNTESETMNTENVNRFLQNIKESRNDPSSAKIKFEDMDSNDWDNLIGEFKQLRADKISLETKVKELVNSMTASEKNQLPEQIQNNFIWYQLDSITLDTDRQNRVGCYKKL